MNEAHFPYKTCINVAGIPVALTLRHEETAKYFNAFSSGDSGAETAAVSEDEWRAWLRAGGTDNSYGEFTCATGVVSDALLRHGRCIIHAAAFRFRGRAWLIAGPPGVGKTTQVRNLQTILPGEFPVICGDRPALELTEDDVFVHPSPWNGKEGMRGADGAFLAGLIILERGEKNLFSKLSPQEAISPLFSSLICTAETEETIHELASFADSFLQKIPVYKLTSFSIPGSTELLYRELFSRR